MKSVLVINDHSEAARHAAELGLAIAQKLSLNLVLFTVNSSVKILALTEHEHIDENTMTEHVELAEVSLIEQLTNESKRGPQFQPKITVLSVESYADGSLAKIVNQNNTWMVIKGVPGDEAFSSQSYRTIRAMLNRIGCPVMLVPQKFVIKDFERMVYTVDLRYCKLQVVSFLKEFARAYGASLLIAHVTESGLPDMEQNYALSIFNGEISNHVKYDKLFFSYVRDKDLENVFDVLTNGLDTDLLAVVNHRFQFEKIEKQYKGSTIAPHITIPLLVFPC